MNLFKKGIFVLSILLVGFITSCEQEDDINIIAGLDFVVATLNAEGTETGVLPSTVPPDGRIVYTVDFGDPNSADDVFMTSGPMVTYTYPEESATYTITVTAALSGREDVTITKEHTVVFTVEVDPGDIPPIAGKWRLAPEAGALGVGPALNDVSWWSNSAEDVTTRACLFDDEYIFNDDGTFQNVFGDQTWIEPWQGAAAEECGTPVFPHNGSASATYAYNATAGTITITGTGAFLGLAKVVNGAELASPGDAPESVTYLTTLSDDGNTLELDVEVAGGGHWSFKMVKEAPPTESPVVGTWRLAPESAALGVGPALNDVSWWSNSSEDVTTRACLFDDAYVFSADGTFQNVLGSETWVEPWQGASAEQCGAPVFPHDGTASATYTYDANAGTITINGRGAFLGLAKVVNGAELASPNDAPDSVTYIATIDGNTMELDIEVANGGHWSFKFEKEAPAANPLVGTWALAPESAALGVGPALNDVSWWSNSSEDVTTRACLFDDQYVFNNDGTFQNILGDQTWLEGWQGNDGESCGTPIAPHDGSASATYTYDESAGTVTINGRGAFLGLAKVINGAEIASPAEAAESITYIASLDGNTLELDIEVANGGHWSFKLVKQ